mmetsp:Transcript_4002/g.6268  ORF Transcript_4002/g.6268 Transcript_4002/m.6268 type:complete len:565 (+) Transcript_4002:43-1737(+)
MALSIHNYPRYGSLEPIPEEEEQIEGQIEVVLTTSNSTRISYENNKKSQESASLRILSSRRLGSIYKLVAFLAIVGYVIYSSHGKDDRYEDGGGLLRNNIPIISNYNPDAYYFHGQQLDHFDPENQITWSHRFFLSDTYFQGPGHPILVIVGGATDNVLYPFVMHGLAKEFDALVLQTEHRFYGASQPVGEGPTNEDLKNYLSPEQAMADVVDIIQYVQGKVGCAMDQSSPDYCPIITIGASHYLGFLSVLMRLYHPDIVDIGYASSAPLLDSDFDDAYLEKVSQVADQAMAGCSEATHDTLQEVQDWVMHGAQSGSLNKIARYLGLCSNSIPSDITSREILSEELAMIVEASYAQSNQNFYPPSNSSDLVKTCQIFSQNEATTAPERYASFLKLMRTNRECFDANSVLANGRQSALVDVDWYGGNYEGRRIWEFQMCQDWMIPAGYNSVFYSTNAWNSILWIQHCETQFEVTPTPRLKNMWSELRNNKAFYKRLLFTNGMNDGWSVTSNLLNATDEGVVALNFPNGAHHSELQTEWPLPYDTDDVAEGFEQVKSILKEWILQV